jgi:hypothetical protein
LSDSSAIRDRHPPALRALAEGLGQHVVEVDHAHLAAARHVDHRHAAAGLGDLDLDLLAVELAFAQQLPELLARGVGGVGPDQGVDHALLGGELGLGRDLLAHALPRRADGDLDQVAGDLVDVAADVSHLGELGRLDLEEGRLGEPGEPAGDLGLADAGRPDHQDVLRQHFLAQLRGELAPPPAVAERDCDRALGVVLADDEAVELGDDLARAEAAAHRDSRVTLRLV